MSRMIRVGLCVVCFLLTITGCGSSVSQEEYDTLKAENAKQALRIQELEATINEDLFGVVSINGLRTTDSLLYEKQSDAIANNQLYGYWMMRDDELNSIYLLYKSGNFLQVTGTPDMNFSLISGTFTATEEEITFLFPGPEDLTTIANTYTYKLSVQENSTNGKKTDCLILSYSSSDHSNESSYSLLPIPTDKDATLERLPQLVTPQH